MSASGLSPWILVVDSGSGQNRSALAAVRALAAAGYRAAVTVSATPSLAASSRHCAKVVTTPAVGHPEFVGAVRAELAASDYLGVMLASDAVLNAFSPPGADLVNKATLARRAADLGIRMPATQTFNTAAELVAAASGLQFPVVVKSGLKAGPSQRPAQRVDAAAQLEAFGDGSGPWTVQPFIAGPMHSLVGVMWKGRLHVGLQQQHLRIWPPVCGDACTARSTELSPQLRDQVERLLAEHEGIFQVEFVGDHLLDVNPRVYGSLPLATAAGCDLVAIYWSLVRDQPIPSRAARPGVMYHWLEGELWYAVRRLPG